MKYLLDTNIIVFLLRGRSDVAQRIDGVGLQNCAVSEITKAELLTGYYKAQMVGRAPDDRVMDLLDALEVIPVSAAVDIYAKESARLQLEGCPIDDFDLLIAATAVAEGMVLVTDNVSLKNRVQSLVMENFAQR